MGARVVLAGGEKREKGDLLKQTFGVAIGRDIGKRKTTTKSKAVKAKNNLSKLRTLTLDLDFSDLSSAGFLSGTVVILQFT